MFIVPLRSRFPPERMWTSSRASRRNLRLPPTMIQQRVAGDHDERRIRLKLTHACEGEYGLAAAGNDLNDSSLLFTPYL